MYDFLRMECKSEEFLKKLTDSSYLKNKVSELNKDTGEIYLKTKCVYKGLRFELFPGGRIVIYGSLHKYFNDGGHNYNDFGYRDLVFVMSDLVKKFGKEILKMNVTSLEFGLNITPIYDPTFYTDRFIAISNKPGEPIIKKDCKGYDKGVLFAFTDKIFKFYNKSKQYRQQENILRCEVKYLRSRAFSKSTIILVRDLLFLEKTDSLFNELVTTFEGVVFRENISEIGLTKYQQIAYLECINPMYWRSLDKFQRRRKKQQFEKLIKRKAASRYKHHLNDLLHKKYKDLTNEFRKT